MRSFRLVCALGAIVFSLLALAGPGALYTAHADDGTVTAAVTWYPDTGPTYCGGYTYPGSAACSRNLPCGTIVHFADGSTRTCNDAGDLVCAKYGKRCTYWIDIYGDASVPYVYGDYADVWFEYP